MLKKSSISWFSKLSGQFPLRVILIVPFVFQLLTIVGLMGYLSFSSGQQSVNEVTAELRREITARIEQHLLTHLNRAHFVNQMNADALRLGQLTLTKPVAIQRYFWQQLQRLDTVSYISFASRQGQYIGVERREEHTSVIGQKKVDQFYLYTETSEYLADHQGKPKTLTTVIENYDPRQRPWYKDTIAANQPIWSEIYSLIDPQNLTTPVTQTISANQPYYDDTGTFQGVLGTDIFLSQISQFLSTLKIGKTGETFIIERSGLIVASSTSEKPYRINPKNSKEVQRLHADESHQSLIRSAAQHLLTYFGHLNKITNAEQLEFELQKQRQFLQVKPYQDERGIDWLIVVVIPQSDFMIHINANMRLTIALFLTTLLVATIIGFFTAQWVVEPIVRLKIAASRLSRGKWEQKLPTERSDEIGVLAQSFQWMALQLKELFDNLEQKVAERTEQLKQKNELIRQVFGRYLSDEVVDTLLDTKSGLTLGGERRKITLLTSDLRGFTAQSSKLPSEQVIKILNFYLEVMGEVITEYQGTINNFLGDGILVFFGAPIWREDDPERAVACAVAMQIAMATVNEKIQTWGFESLEMGIGINTGTVVVGNVGSEKRTQYTAIGNEVNLTYRIESYTVGGQIFLSESTFKKIKSIVKIKSEKIIRPKGIKRPITIYELEGIDGKYSIQLPEEKEIFIPLHSEMPLQYTVLEGKHVYEQKFKGYLLKLSAKGAIIQCETEKKFLPTSLDNLKINLIIPSKMTLSEDVYAKVLNQRRDEYRLHIRFTTPLPIEVTKQLLMLYHLEWTPDLSVNHLAIDKQHQQLFDKTNELIMSICYGETNRVNEIIIFLEHYFLTHFETEENEMMQYNYPDYAVHKAQHTKFIKKMEIFKKIYYANKDKHLYLTLKIQRTLVEWLVHHIGESDKQLGIFLKLSQTKTDASSLPEGPAVVPIQSSFGTFWMDN